MIKSCSYGIIDNRGDLILLIGFPLQQIKVVNKL